MNKRFPVIIAFDPHGDGALPLTKYKSLAEKYGFIMAGSNDSKNGLPQEEIRTIVGALMLEIRSKYPVDSNRVYLMGFSGGARVAAMAALCQVRVNGVIGCGAGFAGGDQPVLYKFDYFGIAGTADFNMNELLQLREPLSQAGFRQYITTFSGIHEWPPAPVMEEGFQWITLNAMKDGTMKKDDAFISGVMKSIEARMNEYMRKNQFIASADACREAISFSDGLTGSDLFKEKLQYLEKLPGYLDQVASQRKAMEQEQLEKKELAEALQAKDLPWWKSWITRHSSPGNNKEKINPEDTLKNRRLLSFLSLYCYMNANAAISQQNEPAAIRIVAIYEMADPANPEPYYMRAILLARRSENEAAISQLKISVAKGFADKHRLTGQPEFRPMNAAPAWTDLLKSIK